MKELTNERMKDMKRAMIILVLGALMAYLVPATAQTPNNPDWKSTSTMRGTGSIYAPSVQPIGAAKVADMGTTTTSSTPSGPRRAKMDDDDDWGTNQEGGEPGGSPIGDAALPLSLLALAYAVSVALRRKRTAE